MSSTHLLNYLQSSSACGLPLVKSKNKTDCKITVQWIKYLGNYYLYVINGTKSIYKLVLKDNNDILYVDSNSLYKRDDITDIQAYLPTIVKSSNKLLLDEDSKEINVVYYSENIIDFGNILKLYSDYLYLSNDTEYLFKIQVDKRIIKLFNIDNGLDNKLCISNSLHNINRKFLNCHYKDGHIYTNCPPVYVIQGLNNLLPRLENQINKAISEPVHNSYYQSVNKEDEKKRIELIKETNNLLSLLKPQG